jgi:hypothetical protein
MEGVLHNIIVKKLCMGIIYEPPSFFAGGVLGKWFPNRFRRGE